MNVFTSALFVFLGLLCIQSTKRDGFVHAGCGITSSKYWEKISTNVKVYYHYSNGKNWKVTSCNGQDTDCGTAYSKDTDISSGSTHTLTCLSRCNDQCRITVQSNSKTDIGWNLYMEAWNKKNWYMTVVVADTGHAMCKTSSTGYPSESDASSNGWDCTAGSRRRDRALLRGGSGDLIGTEGDDGAKGPE